MSLFKEGSIGPEVKAIQQALKDKGFDPDIIDGEFGPGTEAAAIAFQKSGGWLQTVLSVIRRLKR